MEKTVLVCPKNDEESLLILKITEALDIPTVVSDQPHGAKLSREKKLLERIRKAQPDVERVVIVELPGLEQEKELREAGFEVVIIDHHRYDELDRMKKESSLEQFLELFEIDNEGLSELGFDPILVKAVAAMDRGFIWELREEGMKDKDFQRALKYYRELTLELGGERRVKEERVAQAAWDKREERDGLVIVRSEESEISIRDALSFLAAEEYGEPKTMVIVQGDRRLYVQESERAKELHDHFGGFTFGQDRCWGILAEDKSLPALDEVLSIAVQ